MEEKAASRIVTVVAVIFAIASVIALLNVVGTVRLFLFEAGSNQGYDRSPTTSLLLYSFYIVPDLIAACVALWGVSLFVRRSPKAGQRGFSIALLLAAYAFLYPSHTWSFALLPSVDLTTIGWVPVIVGVAGKFLLGFLLLACAWILTRPAVKSLFASPTPATPLEVKR